MPNTQINCPQCRQPFVADVQQLFDVGENPQSKQILLAGAFNIAQCPHCGYQGRLSMPLVYHDPEKELLLTFFPSEMALSLDEQQKSIGPLVNRVVNNLPQERRKGYLLNPRTVLTLQGMIETILEADGITKEMIKAQENRLELIQRLMTASEDVRAEIIKQDDGLIDRDLFNMLTQLIQSAMMENEEAAAKSLNDVQSALLEHSTKGRELKKEAEEVQEVIQNLQEIGDNITREKLLDLVIKAATDTKLRAYVRMARPGMDYQFFQLLSERIDRARKKGKERLKEIREKLLTYTREIDDEIANRQEIAQQNVEAILQAEDVQTAIEQNINAIDEFFVQAVNQALEKARKEGDLEHSARLQQILDIINELSAPPPEVELIEEFLEKSDNAEALMNAVESRSDEVTPELVQVLSSLVTQTMANLENADGSAQEEQQKLLSGLQAVHEAVLNFSMRRNLEIK